MMICTSPFHDNPGPFVGEYLTEPYSRADKKQVFCINCTCNWRRASDIMHEALREVDTEYEDIFDLLSKVNKRGFKSGRGV